MLTPAAVSVPRKLKGRLAAVQLDGSGVGLGVDAKERAVVGPGVVVALVVCKEVLGVVPRLEERCGEWTVNERTVFGGKGIAAKAGGQGRKSLLSERDLWSAPPLWPGQSSPY